jgi:hypothetical protein
MMEKFSAALLLAICLVMLLRLVMGERRRRGFDAWALRTWGALRAMSLQVWRWRSNRRKAQQVAQEAIRRASADVRRDGNVYRPDSFRGPRKPH